MLGIRKVSTFEGEAATTLQFHAESGHGTVEIKMPLRGGDDGFVLATDTLFSELLRRRLAGEKPDDLAFAFHDALSALIVAGCERARADTGIDTVALTGGVYQNTLLLRLTETRLRERGFTPLLHSLLPPNDGGVGLGQAVYAAQYLQDLKTQEG